MYKPTLLQRLKLRHKIAALGVVGMALCLLPLVQLLRWHSLELKASQSAQTELAPALLAVELQIALLDHQQTTARVLNGESQAEIRRRENQVVVDARLAMLGHRLQSSYFAAAAMELSEMRTGWIELLQRIVSGRSSQLHSQQAHRLLIEQTLQIIDNVSLNLNHIGAEPLRLAAAKASSLAATYNNEQSLSQAQTMLLTAQSQIEQAQAGQTTLQQRKLALAASALLLLLVLIAGLIGYVMTAWRRAGRAAWPGVEVPPGATARLPASWQPGPEDGQQPNRMAKLNLLRRLQRPDAAQRPADQPTQAQDL